MNNTITLSQLITRLAKVTGTDVNTARRFIRTFFAAIEEQILDGDTVAVKGFGTFRRVDDPAFAEQPTVAFIPDRQLAEDVNAPFSMFEPVELADGLDFPEEKAEEIVEEKAEESVAPPVVEPFEEAVEETAEETVEETTVEPVAEPAKESVEEPLDETPAVTIEEKSDPAPSTHFRDNYTHRPSDYERYQHRRREEAHKKKTYPWLWPAVALTILGGAACGYFAAVYEPDDDIPMPIESLVPEPATTGDEITEVSVDELEPAQTPEPVEPAAVTTAQTVSDSTPATPAAPAAEPRYDTVSSSRFLATMAREYYGKGIYWVFIYQANTDVLDNPNRIKPGTRVRIPERSSFAESTTEATDRKAERIQSELFKKYK